MAAKAPSEKLPSQRVFRPQNEVANLLINKLMEVHRLRGDIPEAGWTDYVKWLVNRDLAEIRGQLRTKFSGVRR